MHSLCVLLALLFACTATSYAWPSAELPTLKPRKHYEDNNTSLDHSERVLKKLCKKMRRLTIVSEIAANQTKLDVWVTEGKLDANEVNAIKAKAANATTELQAIRSNTTLVGECAIVDAERKSAKQCKQMKQLAKLAALAGNDTAMTAFEEKKGLNETQIETLKAKVSEASVKLQAMQSNTTLANFCAQRQQQNSNSKLTTVQNIAYVFCH